jgi:hypothetical protein
VFPQEELGTFLSLSSQDKEQQLAELTAVVTGIRIFNKFLNKGGEGIDDCEFTHRYRGYQMRKISDEMMKEDEGLRVRVWTPNPKQPMAPLGRF